MQKPALNRAEQTSCDNICESIKNQQTLDVDQKKVGKALAEVWQDDEIYLVLDILLYAVGKTPDDLK